MKILRLILGGLGFLLALTVLLFLFLDSLKYKLFDSNIGFLQIKLHVVDRFGSLYLPAFYFHIWTATWVAFVGLFQFFGGIRRKVPAIHRWLGRVYIGGILLVAAPSGFVMAWFATGASSGIACFVCLAICWWAFTFVGWRRIVQGNVAAHRRWMIRSYAITSAALLLRIYLALSTQFVESKTPELYAWIAWGSWVPNVIVVEICLRLGKRTGSD